MENEGYIYPQKIHRTKQVNFEPIEIHYKVHSYAYKQFNNIKTLIKKKNNKIFKSSQIFANLKILYANLKRFSFHAIEQKGTSGKEFYVENSVQLLDDQEFGNLFCLHLKNTENNKCIIVNGIEEDVLELVRKNFFSL